MVWGRFNSGDPDIRVKIEAVRDQHVLLLMNMDWDAQDDQSSNTFFDQMALLLHLQRFRVPKPDEAAVRRKWKDVAESGYLTYSVKSLTIVCPWNRFAQMQLPRRWKLDDRESVDPGGAEGWSLSPDEGEYIEVLLTST